MTTHNIAGTVAAASTFTGTLSYGRPRYRISAVIQERRPVMDAINDILTTCQGRCWWSDGKWHFAVDDHARPATYHGSGATYATGKHGKALRITQEGGGASPNEYLEVDIDTAGITNAAGTVELWVNFTTDPATNQVYIFDGSAVAFKNLVVYITAAGHLEMVYGTGAANVTLTGAATLTTSMWYHVAFTWGPGGGALYLNGAAEDTDATASGLDLTGNNTGTLRIGTRYSSQTEQLRGYVDDLRISTAAHSAATIAADYAAALLEPLPVLGDTALKIPFDDCVDAVRFHLRDPRTSANTLTAHVPILADGGRSSLRAQRSLIEAPNTAIITYIDPDDYLQREARYETAEVSAGTDQPKELRMRGYGIPGGNQAYRLAKQWILQSQRTLRLGCRVPQHGLSIAPGDVGQLTSAIGPFTDHFVRVNSVTDNADGTFDLELIEYNGDENSLDDTYTPEIVPLPGADNSDVEYVIFEDDFRSGGTTSGSLGELGWIEVQHSGAAIVYAYSTEAGHPGILTAQPPLFSTFRIALSGSNRLFAAKAVWYARFLLRIDLGAVLVDQDHRFGIHDGANWLHYVKKDKDAKMYVDGVDTGYTSADTDWITHRVWCDGGTTAYYEMTWASYRATGSFAVSTTTINEMLAVATLQSRGADVIHVDRVDLVLMR
jgi:hypothetical protein